MAVPYSCSYTQGLVLGSYDYMELNVAVVTGLGGPAGGSADREVEGGREWVGGLATEWLKAKLLDSSTQVRAVGVLRATAGHAAPVWGAWSGQLCTRVQLLVAVRGSSHWRRRGGQLIMQRGG